MLCPNDRPVQIIYQFLFAPYDILVPVRCANIKIAVLRFTCGVISTYRETISRAYGRTTHQLVRTSFVFVHVSPDMTWMFLVDHAE